MKKNLTKIAGIALASLSLLLVGCPKETETPEPTPTPIPEPEPEPEPVIEPTIKPDADADTIHAMILPHGTEAPINAWEKAADALDNNLPDFVTNFSDFKTIKIINEKGEEKDYKTQELNNKTNRTPELKAAIKNAVDSNSFAGRKPKNVIIIFGDGMGESHIAASRHYYGDLIMDLLPYHAPVNHNSYPKPGEGAIVDNDGPVTKTDAVSGRVCTDSSAGGTAIVTGFKTRYGYIGLDTDGTPVKNLAELAREKGMLVGNVTNDHMGDATPADVSVHSLNRNYQDSIYGKLFLSSPDIAMGSDYGYSNYIQESNWGKDGRETIDEIFAEKDAKTKASTKYPVTEGTPAYNDAVLSVWFNNHADALQKWAIDMLNTFDGKDLTGSVYDYNNWYFDRNMHSYDTFKKLASSVQADYKIRPIAHYSYNADYDYDADKGEVAPKFGYKLGYGKKNSTLPTYPEMVALTLSVLDHKAKADGDRGFYCLIENTVSDGWGHARQPYDCMNEIQCFDEGLAIALKYVIENPDTLLVVSADHETGAIEYRTGWENNYKKIRSGDSGHSTKPVPVYAFGAGSEQWAGYESFDTSKWTADNWANYVAGHPVGNDKDGNPVNIEYSYQNRQTGIRIAKAMGFEHFGDLNANGVLDPDTEYDSIVDYKLSK